MTTTSKFHLAFWLAIFCSFLFAVKLVWADGGLTPAFVLLRSDAGPVERQQVETAITTSGGHVIHIFPNRALIARLPGEAVETVASLPAVVAIYTQKVELATMDPFGPDARRLAGVWNNLISPELDVAAAVQLDAQHPDPLPDARVAPDRPAAGRLSAASSGSVRPGYLDTSGFMAGSVAVSIVLLESDGSLEASTEDWTSSEKQLVFNEIVNALNWWDQLAPAANLTFIYEDHFTNPLPTGVEPIRHSSFDYTYGEPRWIGDAMAALGYSGYYFTQVRNYNNALRSSYNTDWAFTVFVVDSSNDTDNMFADGYFAYAYLGGPFLVMTSGNDGYGPYNMDAVAAHEIGHIFNALDQYYNAAQPCTRTSGYLQVENQNSQYGSCASNVASIMRGQVYPYSAKLIDAYGTGQLGWRDSDGDEIFDPLDVGLPISIDSFVQQQNTITVTGSTQITPYPSPGGTSFTINNFVAVQYRLDGSSWQTATIDSLASEGTSATFSFVATDILAGDHLLEVTALDTAGNVSEPYATQTFTVAGLPDNGINTELSPSSSSTITGTATHSGGGIITSVEYRVDGGSWQPAIPQDGAFNSSYEPFTIVLDMPAVAQTQTITVEARASDNAGHTEVNTASEQVSIGSEPSYSIFLPLVGRGM